MGWVFFFVCLFVCFPESQCAWFQETERQTPAWLFFTQNCKTVIITFFLKFRPWIHNDQQILWKRNTWLRSRWLINLYISSHLYELANLGISPCWGTFQVKELWFWDWMVYRRDYEIWIPIDMCMNNQNSQNITSLTYKPPIIISIYIMGLLYKLILIDV